MLAACLLVFISYAHRDARDVAPAAARLELAGCRVWIDREQVRRGENWHRAVAAAVDRAGAVLDLGGAGCHGCREEVSRARREGKPVVSDPRLLEPLCR